MKKKCKVVLLPTNKPSRLYFETMGELVYLDAVPTEYKKDCPFQELYILSDDKIEDGDWVLCSNGNVKQINNSNINDKFVENWLKIIATTDKSLQIHKVEHHGLEGTMDLYTKLPEIPQDFIKSYCDNPIDEVEVEYEVEKTYITEPFGNTKIDACVERLKLINNTIIISPIEEKMYSKDEVTGLLIQLETSIKTPYSLYDKYGLGKWIHENLK